MVLNNSVVVDGVVCSERFITVNCAVVSPATACTALSIVSAQTWRFVFTDREICSPALDCPRGEEVVGKVRRQSRCSQE